MASPSQPNLIKPSKTEQTTSCIASHHHFVTVFRKSPRPLHHKSLVWQAVQRAAPSPSRHLPIGPLYLYSIGIGYWHSSEISVIVIGNILQLCTRFHRAKQLCKMSACAKAAISGLLKSYHSDYRLQNATNRLG